VKEAVCQDLEKLKILPSEILNDLPLGDWRRVQRAEGVRVIAEVNTNENRSKSKAETRKKRGPLSIGKEKYESYPVLASHHWHLYERYTKIWSYAVAGPA
jgi:hypothetical protein